MKIQLWSVGKEHEPYIQQGLYQFSKRLQHYTDFDIKLISSVKNASRISTEELKKREAALILEQLVPQDYLVALDEQGELLTTLQFATFLQQRANTATRQLIFLVGGAFGLDPSVLRRADLKLSLSLLTFPHQLVRLIMVEQLYRAFTVLNNEKYHHQ